MKWLNSIERKALFICLFLFIFLALVVVSACCVELTDEETEIILEYLKSNESEFSPLRENEQFTITEIESLQNELAELKVDYLALSKKHLIVSTESIESKAENKKLEISLRRQKTATAISSGAAVLFLVLLIIALL